MRVIGCTQGECGVVLGYVRKNRKLCKVLDVLIEAIEDLCNGAIPGEMPDELQRHVAFSGYHIESRQLRELLVPETGELVLVVKKSYSTTGYGDWRTLVIQQCKLSRSFFVEFVPTKQTSCNGRFSRGVQFCVGRKTGLRNTAMPAQPTACRNHGKCFNNSEE